MFAKENILTTFVDDASLFYCCFKYMYRVHVLYSKMHGCIENASPSKF